MIKTEIGRFNIFARRLASVIQNVQIASHAVCINKVELSNGFPTTLTIEHNTTERT